MRILGIRAYLMNFENLNIFYRKFRKKAIFSLHLPKLKFFSCI